MMRRMPRVALFLFGLQIAGCADPAHDAAVAALGPEQSDVPKGPDHRAGQPCLTCHGGDGPADLVMAFGGTVYAHQDRTAAAPNATVRVVGADEKTYETTTNCKGNFWVPEREFTPAFPAGAAVTSGNVSRVMRTEMHRSGSCNECHTAVTSPSSPGRIWVLPNSQSPSLEGCP